MFARHREALRRGDDGSVLPMVLVLVVIGTLIVLPLLDYTIAVFRSNRVVSDRTAQSEAAKAGLRVALADPKNVFLTCDGGGNLTPSPNPTINDYSVQTTCTEEGEVGPAVALGFDVPIGAAAMQLGAEVPVALSGGTPTQPVIPPYPATPDWWATPAYPDPGDLHQYSPYAADGKIWMPHLPRVPPTVRPATPYDMPSGYDCKVFFPGRYDQPVDLTGRIYFTSGVYYFEEPVTVQDGADVVVGYGLADFAPASDCADDLQVAANVENPPTSFDINGGGATFVFGGNGRFVVDNAAFGNSTRVRFNQRYSDEDRGGRVSIMTVNGDDVLDADHVVTDVNSIPRSQVLRIDEEDNEILTPINSTSYTPSDPTYTDKARLPARIPVVNAEASQKDGSAAIDRGVVTITWDELTGQDAGGALLGEEDSSGGWNISPYQVQYRVQSPTGPWTDVCPADELILTPKTPPTDGNEISCSIDGLDLGTEYRFRVRAENEVGTAQWRGVNATPDLTSPTAFVPGSPTNVQVVPGASDDVAQISWDAPVDDGGAPITGYRVDASSIEIVSQPNLPPVAAPMLPREHVDVEQPAIASPDNSVTGTVKAYDPNGDVLSLSIDTSLLPPGLTAVANADNTITFTATSAAPLGIFTVDYTVTDPFGETATGRMDIDVMPIGGVIPHLPEADPVVVAADPAVPLTVRVPANDADGQPYAPVPVTVDTSGLADPSAWTVTVSGMDVTITTTAPPGSHTFDYTFFDAAGNGVTNTIEVQIPPASVVLVDSCSVGTDPAYVKPTVCEISLPDLPPGTPTAGYQGYRFDVVAINDIGESVPGTNATPLPFGFDGGGVGLLGRPLRQVVPWVPEPVLDIDLTGSAPVELAIAGYVATPMSRLRVNNPGGFDVTINGGVMTGTFDIDDPRAGATPDTLPIGFKNNIVLQRKVRIVSTAGTVRSIAIVEVNEDGAGYAVNTWVVG